MKILLRAEKSGFPISGGICAGGMDLHAVLRRMVMTGKEQIKSAYKLTMPVYRDLPDAEIRRKNLRAIKY